MPRRRPPVHVPHKPAGNSRQLVVRIQPELGAFVDREVERIRRENPGLDVTPSDVVRMALRRLQTEREGGRQ
jgi:Arc/MetJ-type ribon-helix-helix transcriptional regulator